MRRPTTERVFIPEFCGNRDLDESEQVTIEVSIATIQERDKFSKMLFKKGGKVDNVKNVDMALKKKVSKISNYFRDDGEPIDTAEKLISDASDGNRYSIELATEIWNRIMGYDTILGEDEPEEMTEGED